MSQQVTIETTLLVAVWSQPAVFQGCIKVTPVDSDVRPNFLFFRCEYKNNHGKEYVDEHFFPHEYHFTHLYNESHGLLSEISSVGMEYLDYILKYALYKTLLEMRYHPKQKFIAMDDVAMKEIIKKVEPILQGEDIWKASDEHIGFAVAMDFFVKEQMGQMAMETLFNFCSNHRKVKERIKNSKIE